MNNGLDILESPWRITFETNPDRCNLHCIMCDTHSKECYRARHGKDERMLPVNVITETIRDLSRHGLKEVIPSTMGEPLLYPSFDTILETISECGVKLNLTTNGTFPLKGVDRWSELILPVASDVKISMNGATKAMAEGIMVGLDFEKQLDNVRRFIAHCDEYRKNGFNPTVTMQPTFMRRNLDELPAMLELAIDMGFDRFKGHHVWITNKAMARETLRVPEYIDRWNAVVAELESIAKGRIKLDNVYKIDERILQNSKGVCPFLGREAWIECDGSFQVCCCPSEERAKFGPFGNVGDAAFIDLWGSGRYHDFVIGWGDYEPCSHCNMRVDSR